MNHVGLMTVKNEQDVIGEWAAAFAEKYAKDFAEIVILDSSDIGNDTVSEAMIILPCPHSCIPMGQGSFTDADRQSALDLIRTTVWPEGATKPPLDTWVTLLHPDECFEDSPVEAAVRAEAAGATCVLWGEYRFFPHTSESNWEDFPAKRLQWWCGPFFEYRQFRLSHHYRYTPGRNHCVLPSGDPDAIPPSKRASFIPRYRHYPFRSIEQMKRHAGELMRGERMVQPDWDWVCELVKRNAPDDDYFVDKLPEPKNSPLAAWWNIGNGPLPRAQPFFPAGWKG